MRIIGGELKGRKFSVPAHFPVRPTTDYAREALFNILHNSTDFHSISLLDLFCGTGSISLEAWSRGCRDIVAVDKHAGCCKYLAQLVVKCNIEGINIQKEDALVAIERNKRKFDLIFADPPYDYSHYEELVNLLMYKDMLHEDGMIIIEHGSGTKPQTWKGYVNTRQYGSVHFSFFKNNSEA